MKALRPFLLVWEELKQKIVGKIILKRMKTDPALKEWFKKEIEKLLIKKQERVLLVNFVYLPLACALGIVGSIALYIGMYPVMFFLGVTGLEQRRFRARRSVYNDIIQSGMESGSVPALTQVLHAVEQLDKLDGKIVERKDQDPGT